MLAKNNSTLTVALQNLVPSDFMDSRHFDFKALQATGVADPAGDKAFDPEEFPAFVPSAFAGLPVVPH